MIFKKKETNPFILAAEKTKKYYEEILSKPFDTSYSYEKRQRERDKPQDLANKAEKIQDTFDERFAERYKSVKDKYPKEKVILDTTLYFIQKTTKCEKVPFDIHFFNDNTPKKLRRKICKLFLLNHIMDDSHSLEVLRHDNGRYTILYSVGANHFYIVERGFFIVVGTF